MSETTKSAADATTPTVSAVDDAYATSTMAMPTPDGWIYIDIYDHRPDHFDPDDHVLNSLLDSVFELLIVSGGSSEAHRRFVAQRRAAALGQDIATPPESADAPGM